ncbi:hypothetical protein PFISCL1PPCAC_853, partial [Pristionchus fissidentatus]
NSHLSTQCTSGPVLLRIVSLNVHLIFPKWFSHLISAFRTGSRPLYTAFDRDIRLDIRFMHDQRRMIFCILQVVITEVFGVSNASNVYFVFHSFIRSIDVQFVISQLLIAKEFIKLN